MEQQPQLDDLLHRCTVRLVVPDGHGTGFFVAPGFILTCAHVVKAAQANKTPVTVFWNSHSYTAQIIEFRDNPNLDLALLKIDLADHPCVLLYHEAKPFSKLYSYGYPTDYSDGASVTFEVEGMIGDQQERLKFKQGQVQPGMSGASLLNWQTGGVCGIVQFTRGRSSDLGGDALLTKTVFQQFPELEELQKRFHKQDKRWYECLTVQQRQNIGLVAQLGSASVIEIFFSYAHKDEKLRDELAIQLKLMQRQGLITAWHDRNISGGTEWKQTINTHLNTAQVILLLVSPDFIASDYCYDIEMTRALARHEAKEARVIPIILRPTDWHTTPFGKLQSLPKDGKPVVSWPNRDEAFLDVTKGIRRVVEELAKNPR